MAVKCSVETYLGKDNVTFTVRAEQMGLHLGISDPT